MSTRGKDTPDMNGFRTILRENRLKATPQRLAVHAAMMEMIHASADMVCRHVRENSQVKITQSSVYNILSQLSLCGIYARRFSADNKMYFDIRPFKHIHLYDSRRNEFIDVEDEEVTAYLESHFKKRKFRGYKLDNIDVQLICHSTRKNNKQP